VIGVKPAPKPEPEDGADGAEPKGEDGEEKEQEKPRGNGTMWALFPGGYQVLHYALAPRALPGSLTFSGLLRAPPLTSYLFHHFLANSHRYGRRQHRNLRSKATEEHTRACTSCEIRQYLRLSGEQGLTQGVPVETLKQVIPCVESCHGYGIGRVLTRVTRLLHCTRSRSLALARSLCPISVSTRASGPSALLFYQTRAS
jgi:hypothetical protein